MWIDLEVRSTEVVMLAVVVLVVLSRLLVVYVRTDRDIIDICRAIHRYTAIYRMRTARVGVAAVSYNRRNVLDIDQFSIDPDTCMGHI